MIYLSAMIACTKCNKVPKVLRLTKCAECFKPLCEDCAFVRYARKFCSKACANAFFFGTGEDLG